jgi:hypothetical protein
MPCNLAVSIAKAAVADERLRALLTAENVQTAVLSFLQRQYARSSPQVVSAQGGSMVFAVGDCTISIEDGVVAVDGPRRLAARTQQLSEEVSQLLTQAADLLFQQQIQQALAGLTDQVEVVEVDNGGVRQPAAVFTLTL